jgi:hypothetical protein
MELYVKKLVSLNPQKYEFWEIQKANIKYLEYFAVILKKSFDIGKNKHIKAKTFEEWLKSEI